MKAIPKKDQGEARQEQHEQWKRRGELTVRFWRYFACLVVGYLLGVVAGGFSSDPPSMVALGAVGLGVLWLVFRRGAKSQAHAAIDAILAAEARADARAEAAAAAAAQQVVTVAGGHVVQGSHGAAGVQPPVFAHPGEDHYEAVDRVQRHELDEVRAHRMLEDRDALREHDPFWDAR